MSLDPFIQTISAVLRKLGIDPAASQVPEANGGGWAVPRENGVLFIAIKEVDGQPTLRLVSPILFMPSQDLLPFYRKLLDLNSDLAYISLGMDRDIVCVACQQALDGLDPAAIENLIQITMKSADGLTEMLIAEFNSARLWRPG